MVEQLEAAVLAKDTSEIVRLLSTWSEEQREQARRPFAIFILAHGMDATLVSLLAPGIEASNSLVEHKREKDGIKPRSKSKGDYDYDLQYVAWLAAYGISGKNFCSRFLCTPDYEVESAQILADRRPAWLGLLLEKATKVSGEEPHYHSGIEPWFWARLYEHGLVQQIDQEWIARIFVRQLADCFKNAEEATKFVISRVVETRDALYKLTEWPWQLHRAKDWAPAIAWMASEGFLGHKKYLQILCQALDRPLNQTERNGCITLARAILSPAAKCPQKTAIELQDHWIALLRDSQATVAAFGLEQLLVLEKRKKLDVSQVVDTVPAIFQHKTKTHVIKGIDLLTRMAQTDQLRYQALSGICQAVCHPNKDVQSKAIETLAAKLDPRDTQLIDQLDALRDVVVPTLKPKLEMLLTQLMDSGKTVQKSDEGAESATTDLEEVKVRLAKIKNETSDKLRLKDAIDRAEHLDLAPIGEWAFRELPVLSLYDKFEPIQSVDELIEITSKAVEFCDCPETPDRIIDGIVRFYQEKDEHFDVKVDSLKSRACEHISLRPQGGLVAGVLGDAFSELIAAWLKVPEDLDALDVGSFYPMENFIVALAKRIRNTTAYIPLSIPTHRNGWIDPAIWVERLQFLEKNKIEPFEEDVVRSLLRVAPDGRGVGWKAASTSKNRLSGKYLKLAQFVLDPKTPNEQLAMDDSWSLNVWFTAIRARDSDIDLTPYLPDSEREQVPDELWEVPDAIVPARYVWRAKKMKKNGGQRSLIEAVPLPLKNTAEEERIKVIEAQLSGETERTESFESLIEEWMGRPVRRMYKAFYTGYLHNLGSYPAPAYIYPFLATHWPEKLNWYWVLAAKALSRRIESNSSVFERYDQFLLPLLDQDRYLESLSVVALWVATASKDPNAKTMATEAWISIIADDRAPILLLVDAWRQLEEGEWIKLNRVADVLNDVANVSPHHAFCVARVIEEYLRKGKTFGRDIPMLLSVLNECNERLGRVASDSIKEVLSSFKSGKGKTMSAAILKRTEKVTEERKLAVVASLNARLARAERFAR